MVVCVLLLGIVYPPASAAARRFSVCFVFWIQGGRGENDVHSGYPPERDWRGRSGCRCGSATDCEPACSGLSECPSAVRVRSTVPARQRTRRRGGLECVWFSSLCLSINLLGDAGLAEATSDVDVAVVHWDEERPGGVEDRVGAEGRLADLPARVPVHENEDVNAVFSA